MLISDFQWSWGRIKGIKGAIIPKGREDVGGSGHGTTVKVSKENRRV
jgi:hypothetical protein